MILWAFYIVESLWAITIVVLPSDTLSRVYYIAASFYLSNALVASSNNNILGFFSIALAIHSLYFYPPENWLPLVPTSVSNPFSNCDTNVHALAYFKAETISSSEAFSFP